MLKGRRVGTFSAGLIFIVTGIVYLLKIFIPAISLNFIASLWPIILILIGTEILISYIYNKESVMKYDAGAIILIIVISLFAMSMGGMEYVINHLTELRNIH